MTATQTPRLPRQVGRYAIYDPIATGGMATVHLGRFVGPVGFGRTVAIKRLHPQFARDPEFVSMFLDEARLAARIQHPNVVPTIDVIATDGELLLVMEYVRGEALSKIIRKANRSQERVPPRIAVAVVTNALHGLHAAHEVQGEAGRNLGIVHRDVSPQNILVGMDGVARVLDFGVAKAEDRVQVTKDNKIKGKLLYMSPEQLGAGEVDRRADIYAMAVVLFETLTGQRMFGGDREAAQLLRISQGKTRVPSEVAPDLAPFDEVVRKASAMNPAERYETAREMARALEAVTAAASPSDVSEWVEAHAGESILERARRVKEIESAAALDVNDVRQSLNEELVRSQSELPSVPSLVSHESSTPPKAKPPWLWIGAAAFALLVGVVVSFFLRSPARAPDTVAKPSPVETTSEPATATSGMATSAPLPPTTTRANADSSEAPIVARPPQHAAPLPTRQSKPDCEQPYVVDSSGHMHFRKECL